MLDFPLHWLRKSASSLFGFLLAVTLAHGQIPLDSTHLCRTADSLFAAGDRSGALQFLTQEKTRLEGRGVTEGEEVLTLHYATGRYFYKLRNYPEAQPHYRTALRLHQQSQPDDLANRAQLLTALGLSLENDAPEQALPIYREALVLNIRISGENSHATAWCYHDLAIAHTTLGEFDEATDYAQKAIRCLENAGLTQHADYAGFHQVIGLIYQTEGNLHQAIGYFGQALPLLQNRLGDHIETAKCLSTIGETYADLGDIPKALEYQLASVAMFEKIDSTGPYLSSSLLFLGVTYNIARQPDQALAAFRRMQSIGKKRPLGWYLPHHLSVSYCLLGDYAQACAYADSSLIGLGYAKGVDLSSLPNQRFLSKALLSKAYLLNQYFRQEPHDAYLYEATQLLADARSLISARIGQFSTERNKLAAYREAFSILDLTLNIYIQLHQITGDPAWLRAAFECSETSKGLLLYQQLLQSKSRRQSTVPTQLTEEEKSLSQQIVAAEKQRFELPQPAPQPAANDLDEQIFSLKKQHERIRHDIRAVCPDYFVEAPAMPTINADTLQGRLSADQGLLEFFVGDTAVTAFLLLRDTLVFKHLGQKKSLDTDVTQFRAALCRYFFSPEKTSELYLQSARDYTTSAHRLYRTLLAPFAGLLPSHLTLVPDGSLAFLSFAALLVELPDRPDCFHLHHYAAQDFTFRYAPSATLLREMENRPDPNPNSDSPLLALAPFFDGSTTWHDSLIALHLQDPHRFDASPLPYSGEEVFKIARIRGGGTVLTGQDASKAAFLRLAPHHRVLHLATHARANDRAGHYSFVAFAPQPGSPEGEHLYASEIYGLLLSAELVTLSACETGAGQMLRGEGVVSVARAFASAGAGSIVQSQWAVSDDKTRRLMEIFYQNLKSGQPKDIALQTAQTQYLHRYRGEEAHPYYWAAFLMVGDAKPLHK